jgi:hypothetical protein
MKKQTTGNVLKTVFTSALMVTVLFFSTANAAEKNTGKTAPYELKYVGKIQEQPIFQLDIENPEREEMYLTIFDQAGNVLYADKFAGKTFSKKFQFEMIDGLSTKIKMTISSKSTRQSQQFEINNVQKMFEEVVVTKVS